MIFSHWYFCHTLKMSPQDTCNYLEFLFQMEEGTTMAEKIEALKWLEKQDDSLLQAYAVPLLVKGVLVGGRQDEPVPNGNGRFICLKAKISCPGFWRQGSRKRTQINA